MRRMAWATSLNETFGTSAGFGGDIDPVDLFTVYSWTIIKIIAMMMYVRSERCVKYLLKTSGW